MATGVFFAPTDIRLDGLISGSGGLIISGSAAITLSRDNTYAGGTSLSRTFVRLGADEAFGTGTISSDGALISVADASATRRLANDIVSGGFLAGGPGNLILDGVISGSGNVQKIGLGVLTLNRTNSFSGGFISYGGTTEVGASGALGTGQFRIFDGSSPPTLRAAADDVTLSNSISLAELLTVDTQGFTLSLTGNRSAATNRGGLTKIGSGTLILTGAGSGATTTTTISGGTLQIGDGGTTGSLGSGDVINNASLVFDRSDDFTVSNVISGFGSLTKQGAGTLTLGGNNSYTGLTTVEEGTLLVTRSEALGALDNEVVVADGATLAIEANDRFDQPGPLTLGGLGAGGTGALRVSAPLALFESVNLSSSTLIVHQSGLMQTTTINGLGHDLTIDTEGEYSTAGSINLGSGIFTKDGSGSVRFNDSNNLTGGIVVNSGTLLINDRVENGALGDLAPLTMNGGSLVVRRSETVGSLTGSSGSEITDENRGTVLTVGGNNQSTTFAGQLAGTLGLTKTGTGTLTLTGSNTSSGEISINGGTLQIGNGGETGSLGTGAVMNNAALVFNRVNDFTVGNAIGGSGTLTKLGAGTLTLSRTNTYSGATTVAEGTLRLTTSLALGTGQGDTTVLDGATLALAAPPRIPGEPLLVLSIGEAITLNGSGVVNGGGRAGALRQESGFSILRGTITLGSTSLITADAGTLLTLDGPVSGAGHDLTLSTFGDGQMSVGQVSLGTGRLIKNGTGRLDLFGPASISELIIDGGFVQLNATNGSENAAIVDTARVTLTGGSFAIAQNETIGSLSGDAGTFAADFALGRTLTLGGDNTSTTFGGQFLQTLGLQKAGGGTFTLTGENQNSGITTISGGTLQVGDGGETGQLGGGDVVNNASLVFNRSNGATVGNSISGSGSLTKLGAGTLTLTGTNTYEGTTTIGGGTLQIGNGGMTGTLGDGRIINNASLVFNRSNDLTVENDISGTGTLTKLGAGTLALDGVNTFSGGILLEQGRITISDNGSLGTGTFTMAQGTTLFARISNLTLGNDIVLGGGLGSNIDTFSIANPTTLTGVLSGGRLNVTGGGGRLVLTGANTYGATTIAAGNQLQIGNGGTTGTLGSGSVANAGQLIFNRANDLTVDNAISGSGSLTKLGAGTLTLTGSNSYSGGTFLEAGGIALGAGNALGSGLLTMAAGTTLGTAQPASTLANAIAITGGVTFDASGFMQLNGEITGTGGLTKTGGSALSLTGDNSFSGDIDVNAGTLILQSANAAGSFGNRVNLADGTALAVLGGLELANDIRIDGSATLTRSVTGLASAFAPVTFSGVISGTGALRLFGGDSGLILTGDNTHSGTKTIAAGFVQIGDGGTSGALGSGDVVNDARLVFDRSDNLIVGNQISGTGSLTQQGGGTLVLTGANTYTGATTISAGTLQIGNGGLTGSLGSGAVVNNAALAFDRADSFVVGNQISGTGSLTKLGTGTLTLTGANTYTGLTRVDAGTLRVMGSLAAAVDVNAGATLTGTGTIGGAVTINAGGTLAPGQSPGTMTLGALALNAGSATVFELGEAGVAGGADNDLIRVTGNLALNGGTINIVRGAGFSSGQYTLFEFGTVSGELGNLTLDPLGGGFFGNLALGAGTVLLNTASAGDLVWWNGTTLAPTGAVAGGDGTWSLAGANFTNAAGTVSGPWAGNGRLAVFGGTGGEVTIAAGEVLAPSGLSFLADGYVIRGGDAAAGLSLAGPTGIDTAEGVGARIDAVISGAGSLTMTGAGTLTLGGNNTYAGLTTVLGGVLVNAGAIAGDVDVAAGLVNRGTLGGTLAVLDGGMAANEAEGMVLGTSTIGAGGTLTSAGTLAAVVNAGEFASTGTVNGSLTNQAGGIAQLAGSLFGSIDNSGTITLTGTTTGIDAVTQSLGANLDLAGFDTSIRSLSGAGSVDLGGGTLTLGAASGTASFAGTIVGTGGLVKTGDSTQVLTGINSYSGLTRIDGGQLTVSGGSLAGPVLNNAVFAIENGARVGGNLTNSGLVEIAGQVDGAMFNAGSVNNLGEATYLGRFTQAAGGSYELAGFAMSIGSLAGEGLVMLGGADLVLGTDATSSTFSGAITGTGRVVKTGKGAFNLSGENSFSGSLEVQDGELTIAAGGSLASALVNDSRTSNEGTVAGFVSSLGLFANNGTLLGGAFSAGTFSNTGIIEGGFTNTGVLMSSGRIEGGLIQSGLASATLSGEVNGGIENAAAIIVEGDLASDGQLGNVAGGRVLVAAGARWSGLTAIDNADVFVIAGELATTGTMLNRPGASLAVDAGGMLAAALIANDGTLTNDGTIIGDIGNEGAIVNAGTITGTLTNDGEFTSTGILTGTLVNAANGTARLAGTLDGAIVNAGTIALTGTTTGITAMTQTASGVFDLAGVDTNLGSLAGSGSVRLGAGRLTVGGNDASTTFAGVIEGAGGLTKVGAGALTLLGLNTYTGSTTIAGGTLALGVGGAIAGDVLNAAILTNAGTIGGNVTSSGTLANSGTIAGTLANGAGGSATNSGTIAGLATNAGTLVSTGTLNGGLVNTGSAQVRGTLSGDVLNAGTLTLTGTTTGIGILEQTASGTFDLAGFDTAVGLLGGAGSITLGGARLTAGDDRSATFAGVISGSGALTKTGGGLLALTGEHTYTGGTTIADGGLLLGTGTASGSILGPVVNEGVLAFNRSDAFTFAGTIGGTGQVIQIGAGTTTLTSANTYTGGTIVSGGRLVGDTTALQGAILIDAGAALEFAQGAAGTFAGVLTGAGLFEKTGAGTLALTGNSAAFTGATAVRAGELRVNGGLAGSVVTLGSGASLSGNGVIGGLVAQSGSTVAPGSDGPDTLGVAGNVTLEAGSMVRFQVQASGPIDRILATGSAGLGGTAALTNLGGVYAFGSEYVLLEAVGGRSGTFDAATGLAGFGILYRPELVYTGTQVRLRMAPNRLANIVGNTALTANQRSVVDRIDGAVTAGYNPQPLFDIYALPTAQLPGAFDQLSGEVYATAAGVGIEQERLVREAVLGRIGTVMAAARTAPEAGSKAGAWAQLFGGWGDGESDGNAAAFDTDRMGFATGIDFGKANENGGWRAGLFGMRIQSDVTIDARVSAAEVRQAGGGAYASLAVGGFGMALGGYLTEVDLRAFRNIALPGLAETNTGVTEGKGRQAFAELSYTLEAGRATIRPFVAGSIGSFKIDALRETGGAAALDVRAQDYATGSVTGGVDGALKVGRSLQLGGTLAARAQLGDRDPGAQIALAASPQQAFAIGGAQLDEVALAARFDAALTLEENLTVSLGYTGLIGATQRDHGARATIQVRF